MPHNSYFMINIVSPLLFVASCSNRSPQVSAEIPLLTDRYINKNVSLTCIITPAPEFAIARRHTIKYNNNQWDIVIKQNYVSALGEACIRIVGNNTLSASRLCRTHQTNPESYWYSQPSILSNIAAIN